MVDRLQNIDAIGSYMKHSHLKVVLPLISIIIPTFHRPRGLATALQSAAIQTVKDHAIEIIVADNSPDGGAKAQVEAFAQQTTIPIKYISEPAAGVANVRNAALTLVKGRYIAFLDDDQEATQGWLSYMIAQCQIDNSWAVFSRIIGRSEARIKNGAAKLDFFSRLHDGQPSGITEKFYGCGASVLDLSRINPALMIFDPARNLTGGEDDAMFSALEKAGATFSWSTEAYVFEDVPASRLRKRYICQRSFAFGQGPSLICVEKESFSLPRLIRWMLIGAIQMTIFLPLALITWPLDNDLHMRFLRKGCEGVGKVFWQSRFRLKFYGQTPQASGA